MKNFKTKETWLRNVKKGRLEARTNPSQIYLRRSSLGLYQSDMAGKLDISESCYGHFERAKGLVNVEKAEKIANILKVPVSKIFVKRGKKYLAILSKLV